MNSKVTEVFKDQKGLVRTVRVAFRRRDKRELSHTYWKRPLSEEIFAVQRLSLLQAANELAPSRGIEDDLLYTLVKELTSSKPH